MSINETIAKVLRLDGETDGSFAYDQDERIVYVWDRDEEFRSEIASLDTSAVPPGEALTALGEGIAYYRTAAPALAREVQRLQAERDADYHEGYRAGQEAMQDRCAALCDDWEADSYCEGWREMEQGAQHCAEAIRALEVQP